MDKARAWCGDRPHFQGVTQDLANAFLQSQKDVAEAYRKGQEDFQKAILKHIGYLCTIDMGNGTNIIPVTSVKNAILLEPIKELENNNQDMEA